MDKQKKNYKRKSVISLGLITLIGIFVFLIIIFVLVKMGVVSNNTSNEQELQESNEKDDGLLGIENTVNVSSYVFNAKNRTRISRIFFKYYRI